MFLDASQNLVPVVGMPKESLPSETVLMDARLKSSNTLFTCRSSNSSFGSNHPIQPLHSFRKPQPPTVYIRMTLKVRLMLLKAVRKKIEAKYGHPIRYPKDCDSLALEISNATGRRISNSTLKRLLGFVKGTEQPRAYTLDIIAEYVNHTSYDSLIEALNPTKTRKAEPISEVQTSQLEEGTTVQLRFEPKGQLNIQLVEGQTYKVISSEMCQFDVGDTFTCEKIEQYCPLFVNDWCRKTAEMGSCVLAKVTGITSIKIIP